MSYASNIRTRIAPTPSGLLHPGNGLSFVLTWVIARAYGGQVLLRIDDLDKARSRDEYIEDIFYTLEWLGINYDEGPSGVEDFHNNWSQHNRLDHYNSALSVLRENEQLFACDCTRKSIRSIAPDGRYPNTCLHKSLHFEASDVSWRVKPNILNTQLMLQAWKDTPFAISLKDINAFIIKQKNGFPAYQLASLIDDQLFDINFIVRGKDLWDSTLSQLYLAYLLDHATFLNTTFWHHPLIRDEKGEKLSKSKGAGSLQSWRRSGQTPEKIYNWVIQHLALPQHTPLHPQSIIAALKEMID